MAVNASSPSSTNASVPASCFFSPPGSSIFKAFTFTNILLLLPLSIAVLSLGFQNWRRRRGAGAMANPTDIFTYHMVAMEMAGICGSLLCCCGAFTGDPFMAYVGGNLFAIISCVKMFFHLLTCVERYLAVVRPITYLSLTKKNGVVVRNVSCGCVWLFCATLMALRFLTGKNFNMILFFCNLVVTLIIISFCSLSVLRALNRPGPGDGGGNRGKADQSKQRAFVTITAIMTVLLLRFTGNLVCQALAASSLLTSTDGCVVKMSGIWFCLPSSYVLPLLFLQKEGKLHCLKHNRESG